MGRLIRFPTPPDRLVVDPMTKAARRLRRTSTIHDAIVIAVALASILWAIWHIASAL